MEKTEIDAARAQAGQVVAVLTPLLQALQSANEVLSVASNAEKLRGALTGDVADLKNQAITLKEAVDALTLRKQELANDVQVAEANARERARIAAQALEETVKEAEAAAQARAAAAAAAAAETEVGFAKKMNEAQDATDAAVAALFTRQQQATDAAAAAEKRLAAIQEQAQKFAAALAG